MNKKLFVVLEQGNKCNTALSKEHRNQFSTEYCDWFRLNWKANENDKEAHFYHDNIVWSEGRSILYDKVKGKYKYYIFIDDDVKFISKTDKSVAEELKYFFEEYYPLTGTIFGDNWAWDLYKKQIINDNKEVFPIMGHDLCCHYFQEDFAELMFPIFFKGSECSMWYSQYLAYKLYPQKCLVFNKVFIKNTEHIPHKDNQKTHFNNGKKVVDLFSTILLNNNDKKEFLTWRNNSTYVRTKNKKIYNSNINKKCIKFEKNKLKKLIFNKNN